MHLQLIATSKDLNVEALEEEEEDEDYIRWKLEQLATGLVIDRDTG